MKLWRSILEWDWFRDANAYRVFTYLLVRVNWRPGVWRGINVPPGSRVTSRETIAKALGLTDKEVRGALSRLEKGQVIVRQRAGSGQLISIVNWEKYQGDEPRQGRKRANDAAEMGPEEGRKRASIEEGKKERREEEVFDMPFTSEAFKAAWATWEGSRKEARKNITPTARRLQFAKCAQWGEARSIAALLHSAANGYQGLFEPKGGPVEAQEQKEASASPITPRKGWTPL